MKNIIDQKFTNETSGFVNQEPTNYESCIFESCDFQNVNLNFFNFNGCTFKNTNLSLIQVKSCTISETIFISCKMIGIDWSLLSTSLLFDNTFENCILDMSNFSLLDLSHIKAIDSTFIDCAFTDVNFSNAVLKNCDFQKALFHNTNFTNADLRRSKNYLIDIRSNIIKNAKFSLPEATNLLLPLDINLEW